MKKHFGWLFLMMILVSAPVLSPAAAATASGRIQVAIDGSPLSFDVQPQLAAGRVLVPMRAVFQALGCQVIWDSKNNSVQALRPGNSLEVFPGKNTASRNGVTMTMDTPPLLINGRILVPLRFVSEALDNTVTWQATIQTVSINTRDLPVLGSAEKLQLLLAAAGSQNAAYRNDIATDQSKATTGSAEAAAAPNQAAAGSDYSQTNIQVAGVDEADVVKTDGQYLYQVNNQSIKVIKALPASEMRLMRTITFDEKNFTPQELYVDSKYLVVIGSAYRDYPVPMLPETQSSLRMMPPYPTQNQVSALIYNIQDKNKISKIRELSLDGSYISSRKIGSQLYLAANDYLDYYRIMDDQVTPSGPSYRDSAAGGAPQTIPWKSIRYFPGQVQANYLLVGGVDLSQPAEKMSVSTYLGAGENIYATAKNLYVAVTNSMPVVRAMDGSIAASLPQWPQTETMIYRFSLNNGQAKFSAKGSVPGTLLNQFSMDEDSNFFRVATTTGESWRSDEGTSKNNIFVLDSKLQTVGKIVDIAPGERIYSVRFLGNRAYLVTFRNVDPLFVIDLKDPQAPKILGALKIPGYSDYLHPYDENHIIGFGKETVELSSGSWGGSSSETVAFYQGMKVALFDVSDVTQPRQMYQTIIGDRGTDSELLRNHKALLFSKEKNLLAFPVTLMEIADKTVLDSGIPAYGQFTFQGAYVYNLDLDNGFQLKGRITHLSDEEILKSGSSWYDSSNHLERILYIGDTLYTLSKGMAKANDLSSLKELDQLNLGE